MSEQELLKQIEQLKMENSLLKAQISNKPSEDSVFTYDEYKRYGRQMLVPEVGFESQLKLKHAKVLVIGAGGLGCPALMYLSGAGIGEIGIVDDDVVDISNIHRQVIHTTDKVGMLKCESAKEFIHRQNPHVVVHTFPERLSSQNAFDIFSQYDLVLDCTDSPNSRYLISDVAVITGIPVVSGSGLKTDGQLSILNFQNFGPCYRCFYPQAPSPNNVTSCKDGGVLGPCIGLMGVMMAIETIKLVIGTYTKDNFKPTITMYTGFDTQMIKVFKMRGRQLEKCDSCSGRITKEDIINGKINYDEFCGSKNYNVLSSDERVSVQQYAQVADKPHYLLDVRPKEHYEISHLSNSISVPLVDLKKIKTLNEIGLSDDLPIYVICRYGNDSRRAARFLNDTFGLNTKDIIGGLFKYSEEINPLIPTY